MLLAGAKEGHRVVARIAASLLSEQALKAADKILDRDDYFTMCKERQHLSIATVADRLACVATWADAVRNQEGYKETAPFHFVNIPSWRPAMTASIAPRQMVVWSRRLKKYKSVLTKATTPLRERREAQSLSCTSSVTSISRSITQWT